MKLVIATQNKGKIKEYEELLGSEFEILSLTDVGFTGDIEETGKTFEENSFIKAKAVYDFCKTPTLADDSGLMTDALSGDPGVFSARYAGRHGDDVKNYTLLLKNLENENNRKARFKTAVTLITETETFTATGETEGEILFAPEGSNGFGYDPVFFSYDLKKSFGVATDEEKNEVSHRSRAVKNLLKLLKITE